MVPSPRKLAYTIVSCSGEVRIHTCLQWYCLHFPLFRSQVLTMLEDAPWTSYLNLQGTFCSDHIARCADCRRRIRHIQHQHFSRTIVKRQDGTLPGKQSILA